MACGALGAFQGQYATDIPLLAAGSLVILAPTIIVFVIFQRQFVSALLQGSLRDEHPPSSPHHHGCDLVRHGPQLLTYPDALGGDLASIRRLLDRPLRGLFAGVHVLPPFPSSGDRELRAHHLPRRSTRVWNLGGHPRACHRP